MTCRSGRISGTATSMATGSNSRCRTSAVGRVVQRLRWILPGTLRMGSPPDEPGRWDDEGPRHQLAIGEGFWLVNTLCTQALWQAVMGENLSRFQSPDRPVEQVS